jgi:hypothetical protein
VSITRSTEGVSEEHKRRIAEALAPLEAMLADMRDQLATFERQKRAGWKLWRHFEHMGYGR